MNKLKLMLVGSELNDQNIFNKVLNHLNFNTIFYFEKEGENLLKINLKSVKTRI